MIVSRKRVGLAAVAALLLAAGTTHAAEITPGGSAASASANDGNMPASAVDNNTGTRWSALSNPRGTQQQWLQLNLGTPKTLAYVKIAFYNGNQRTSTFKVETSNGTNVWKTVFTGTSATNTSEQTFDFTDEPNVTLVRYVGTGNSVNGWNSITEFSLFDAGGGQPTATPTARPTPTPGGGTWRTANLTNFESYPDPDSEECREYNGCTWAGQFAFVNGKQPESWVRAHNIAAVAQTDANRYKLKNLRLRWPTPRSNGTHDMIDVKVYDMCADSDCNGCCTRNRNRGGRNFLIDIEKYTMQRFGHGDGPVDWQCLDCN
jgi:hypothetical protein